MVKYSGKGVHMKSGIRTPSIKKSISVRTTGKSNRAVKSSINPLYGKKEWDGLIIQNVLLIIKQLCH